MSSEKLEKTAVWMFQWGWLWLILIGFFLWLGWSITYNQRSQACLPATPNWKLPQYRKFSDLKEAVAEAKKQKRPIFVDLFAHWCAPCKKLEKNTFSHPSVRVLLSRYLVVKFDIDKPAGRKLVNRFGVNRFPTTLLLDSQGVELERIVGNYPPKFFRPPLEAVLSGKGHYLDLSRRSQKTPNDLPLLLELADRSLLRRRLHSAKNIYRKLLRLDPDNSKKVGAAALFGLARLPARIAHYKQALPFLKQFHKRFPKSLLRGDAYRLELDCLRKISRRTVPKKKVVIEKRYKRVCTVFNRRYPNQSPTFE